MKPNWLFIHKQIFADNLWIFYHSVFDTAHFFSELTMDTFLSQFFCCYITPSHSALHPSLAKRCHGASQESDLNPSGSCFCISHQVKNTPLASETVWRWCDFYRGICLDARNSDVFTTQEFFLLFFSSALATGTLQFAPSNTKHATH